MRHTMRQLPAALLLLGMAGCGDGRPVDITEFNESQEGSGPTLNLSTGLNLFVTADPIATDPGQIRVRVQMLDTSSDPPVGSYLISLNFPSSAMAYSRATLGFQPPGIQAMNLLESEAGVIRIAGAVPEGIREGVVFDGVFAFDGDEALAGIGVSVTEFSRIQTFESALGSARVWQGGFASQNVNAPVRQAR